MRASTLRTWSTFVPLLTLAACFDGSATGGLTDSFEDSTADGPDDAGSTAPLAETTSGDADSTGGEETDESETTNPSTSDTTAGDDGSTDSTDDGSSADSDDGSSSGGREVPSSCADLAIIDPTAASGPYMLQSEDGELFDAYCDMVTDGGGWTLVLKANTAGNTFDFDSLYWTDNTPYNADDLAPNQDTTGAEAKYPAYWLVPGDILRLQFVVPAHDVHTSLLAGQTTQELMSGPPHAEYGSGIAACNGPLLTEHPDYDETTMRFGQGRQFVGINGTSASPGKITNQLRFGFASNDEASFRWLPEVGIGWTLYEASGSLVWSVHDDCDEADCGCYGAGAETYTTSANLWVR